jgi:ABC-type transport system involved in cytochrome c biogenesis ATPase subunit
MHREDESHAVAIIDTIRFASGDNPITEISLRTGRGAHLTKESSDEFVGEEDTNLPIIIGGSNASGKTSMLRGIDLICDLLQNSRIERKLSTNVWSELKNMGIRHLEIQFVTTIGRKPENTGMFHSSPLTSGVPFTLLADEFGDMPPTEIFQTFRGDSSRETLELENIFQVKMDIEDEAQILLWRDGLKIRRVGTDEGIMKMYPKYGDLSEDKSLKAFRKIKSEDHIERFLKEVEGKDVSGLMLTRYNISQSNMDRFSSLKFQKAKMITVNRDGSETEIAKLRNLLPQITENHAKWLNKPEELQKQLLSRMRDNQLFTDLGLKTSDIVYNDDDVPGYHTLHDYAPDIVESLMLKPANSNFYTWYKEYAWKDKQEAINFVMEGCIYDIVNYVTGKPNPTRIVIGTQTGFSSRNGPVLKVEWADASDEKIKNIVYKEHNPLPREFKDPIPALSEVLRELPFLSNLLGMEKKETPLIDILVRFNAFTPIEGFKEPYLSSGQKQVLALIVAVRSAPEGSLILLDEPEISLHVDWQERLVEQLHAPLVGSRLFITTHSPDIVIRHRHLCTTLLINDGGDFYRKD